MMARFFLLAFLLVAPNTHAQNALIADVSQDHISIQSNFTGETLLLFGAIEPSTDGTPTDIVVVLRSPAEDFLVRRKQKRFGIWINSDSFRLGELPGFFAVSSSRPLEKIAPPRAQAKYQLAPHFLKTGLSAEMRDVLGGFVRLRRAVALYSQNPRGVAILNDRLFRAEITLPSGMPVGTYVTEFFAFREGQLVGYQTGRLPVDIVGAGHILHGAAHNMPLLYGLGGVLIAVFMGWGVALIFRRV